MPTPPVYALDLSGTNHANLIPNEVHPISGPTDQIFVPDGGPFYTTGLVLVNTVSGALLRPLIDYHALQMDMLAVALSGKEVCSVIKIDDPTITSVTMSYQVIGGQFSDTRAQLLELLANNPTLPTTVVWGMILGIPDQFWPSMHTHSGSEIINMNMFVTALFELQAQVAVGDAASFNAVYEWVKQYFAVQNQNSGGGDGSLGAEVTRAQGAEQSLQTQITTWTSTGYVSLTTYNAFHTAVVNGSQTIGGVDVPALKTTVDGLSSTVTSQASAITSAQNTASSAATAAASAQSTANSAGSAASTAQSTASTALSAANSAQTNASTALSTAGNANTAATNALTAANALPKLVAYFVIKQDPGTHALSFLGTLPVGTSVNWTGTLLRITTPNMNVGNGFWAEASGQCFIAFTAGGSATWSVAAAAYNSGTTWDIYGIGQNSNDPGSGAYTQALFGAVAVSIYQY